MFAPLDKANELLEEQRLQIEALTKKLHSAQQNITMLQHQVEQLLRRIYGRRSERLDPNQLMLDPLILQALEQPSPPLDAAPHREPKPKQRHSAKRHHPGRIPIPEHLERVEIILDIPEQDKVCPETGKPLNMIGVSSGPWISSTVSEGMCMQIPITITMSSSGRKNWLFAASDRGARATALYLGLIQSCKTCGVNPWEYFNDMLRRVMSHPVTRLRELLPDQWKPLPTHTNNLLV